MITFPNFILTKELRPQTCDQLFREEVIKRLFESDYGIKLESEDMIWLHSENASKTSLHLIISTRDPQWVYSSNHQSDATGACRACPSSSTRILPSNHADVLPSREAGLCRRHRALLRDGFLRVNSIRFMRRRIVL